MSDDIKTAKCLWSYYKFNTEVEDAKRAIDRIGVVNKLGFAGDVETVLEELVYAQIGADRVGRVCPIDEDTKQALSVLEKEVTRVITGERGADILKTLKEGKQQLKAELDGYLQIIINDITALLMDAGETNF